MSPSNVDNMSENTVVFEDSSLFQDISSKQETHSTCRVKLLQDNEPLFNVRGSLSKINTTLRQTKSVAILRCPSLNFENFFCIITVGMTNIVEMYLLTI